MLLGYRLSKQVIVLEKSHPYHVVLNSPWPIGVAFGIFSIMLEIISIFQEHSRSNLFLLFNFALFLIVILRWGSDISIEGSYEGHHTKLIQKC